MFQTHARRLVDLMRVVGEVAFTRIDVRLARRLLQLERGRRVSATHGDLAGELGTAREVVNRQLKAFERMGWVRLGVREVILVKPEVLEALAGVSVQSAARSTTIRAAPCDRSASGV